MNKNRTNRYVSKRASRRQYGRNQNISAYAVKDKLGNVSQLILTGLMLAVICMVYLSQTTKVTSYDYRLNKINKQIDSLAIKKFDLEIEKARLTSITKVTKSKVAANLVDQTEATYITK